MRALLLFLVVTACASPRPGPPTSNVVTPKSAPVIVRPAFHDARIRCAGDPEKRPFAMTCGTDLGLD